MLRFYQLPGYSRVFGPRVPGYSLDYVRNPGHGNISSPKSCPLGSILYDILRETLFKVKMLSHASRLTVSYPGTNSYSPSIWAPGTGVLVRLRSKSRAWQHGNLSFPQSRPPYCRRYSFVRSTILPKVLFCTIFSRNTFSK